MPKPQWRTFSIRVNAKSRKAVGVQARFPLSEDEWDELMAGLVQLRRELPHMVSEPVSVSVRMVEKLQAGRVTP